MFTVYHSNQLDLLKSLLCQLMRLNPLDDPFEPDVVLVQSPGMAQWLRLQVAQEFGIAANMEFPLPATFIWNMFTCVLPDIPKQSAFGKEAMTWKLMTLLPAQLDNPLFEPLRHYLQGDLHADENQRKLYQLAARVADLFDQYLVYRPEWIASWERGETVAELADEHPWQPVLWRELVRLTAELGQPHWHRANLYQKFIQALEQAPTRPQGIPKRLFIFGISALPPVYLSALKALSLHCDVHLMFTNPSRHYWGDIQDPKWVARQWRSHDGDTTRPFLPPPNIGNPLLASMGKLGRDNFYLLAQLEPNDIEAFVEPQTDNLLHQLQRDILNLDDGTVLMPDAEHPRHPVAQNDHSIRINACHSPMREVEVLHDHLLHLLQADPDLTPRDILVMVADINRYSPYIQAVFSAGAKTGASEQVQRIPFSISDRSASQAHPILQAFLQLLQLPYSRFAAEEILALLEVPALARQFGIDEQGLVLLRLWVEESGIRWGLDDAAVAAEGLPVTGSHTWRFGVERMLLGYAMRTDSGLFDDQLPYDEVSGLRAALVGQLAALLETLALWRQAFSCAHTPQAWAALLSDFLSQLFVSDTETEPVLALITRQIERLVEQAALARFDAPLSLAVLRDALSAALDNERISQRFLAGQVNFCTLMPMRSIPFKVVCLLGMNDGVYPRSLPPLGFDLMAGRSQRGDRSRRDDDRYLFLEAILSAQQQLYISYVGRSAQDNTPRAPSVLVSELLDYLQQSRILATDAAAIQAACAEAQTSSALPQKLLQLYTDAEPHLQAHLVSEQTLTPFSPRNFMAEPKDEGGAAPTANAEARSPSSFAGQWLPSASRSGTPAPAFWAQSWQPEAGECELELDAVRQFYRHPVRAFFRQRLRVSFDAPQAGVPDNEPFGLDGLGRYGINQQLLNILLNQESPEQFFRRLRAEGRLPYGSFGELIWENLLADMQALSARIAHERQDTFDWEVELELGDDSAPLQLHGWLQGVQDDGLLRWRPGTLNAVDALNLWLEHLVYCLVCHQRAVEPGVSRMLGRDESQYAFAPLAASEARAHLTRLLEGYQQGLQTPLSLLPKTGWAWLSRCYRDGAIADDDESQQKALRALRDCYLGGYQHNGEGEDPYLQRLFGGLSDDALAQITAQATRYLLPVMQHLSA